MNINVLRQEHSYNIYFKEAWQMFMLSLPLVLIQFANFSKGLADMIMVGHIDKINLAAIAIAGSIYGVIGMFSGGFISSTITVLSKLHGEEDYKQMHYYAHQALYLNFIITILLAILLYNFSFFISFLDVADQTKQIAGDYLKVLAIAFPFFSILNIMRPIMQTFLKNKQLMYLLIAMSILNVPLNYVFMYVFNMGAVGCGIATALCFSVEVVLTYLYIRPDEKMNIFRNYNKPNYADMWSLFKLGYTVGLSIMIELGLGTIIIAALAKYGETVISGHQVVLNYSNIIFAVALGLRFAIMRRVSFLLGLQQIENIRTTIIGSLVYSTFVGVFFVIIMLLFSDYIIAMYTSDHEVMEIAKSILYISIVYQFLNIILTTSIAVLRGYKLNHDACMITLYCYTFVGLLIGYALSISYGLHGFWIGLTLCLLTMNISTYKKVYKLVWKEEN